MKKIFIKYNPYLVRTEITIDGSIPKENSRLRGESLHDVRLQDWVEDLPRILKEECNDTNFDITFHGTAPDYEDLYEAFQNAYQNNDKLAIQLTHKPARNVEDKEAAITEIFKRVQNGPFPELRSPEIQKAFEAAQSKDVEMCVVATMSSGKSTLINALLGQELMPSRQEACTAIITKIKDVDSATGWKAKVYTAGKEAGDDPIFQKSYENITLSDMQELNKNKDVVMIEMQGNIPFVSSKGISLVIVDTPGPDNSRNIKHALVQENYLKKSSKALVLYVLDSGKFATTSDKDLLKSVADSMKVNGKQSKDRFIFVINKMDDRKREQDGTLAEALEGVREYLAQKDIGIERPNLYPVSALPALNIRMIQNGQVTDEDTIDETESKIKKLNRSSNADLHHLEDGASLPEGIKKAIKDQLTNTEGLTNPNNALIHTGIPSLEAGIRQYVEKYAKTEKIKTLVDTFMGQLEELGCYEHALHELSGAQQKSQEIEQQIAHLSDKIDDLKSAQRFETSVKKAVEAVQKTTKKKVESISAQYHKTINSIMETLKEGEKYSLDDAKRLAHDLHQKTQNTIPAFTAELGETLQEQLMATCNNLLDTYQEKIRNLTSETNTSFFSEFGIDPLQLTCGSLKEVSVQKLVRTEQVEGTPRFVKNTHKKWYKFWTWFEADGHWEKVIDNREYVSGAELAQAMLAPIEEQMLNAQQDAIEQAKERAAAIQTQFLAEFKRLDRILQSRLQEMKRCATDQKAAEQHRIESQKRLEWIEQIKCDMNKILEI